MTSPGLTAAQMSNAIERRGGDIPRVPFGWARWYNERTRARYGRQLEALDANVAEDFVVLQHVLPGDGVAPEGAPVDYRWSIEERRDDLSGEGWTSRIWIDSVELIDTFLENLPDPAGPACPSLFAEPRRRAAANPGRYLLAKDFFCLFERAWFLFGMENIMCEMVDNPERLRRLHRGFVEYHKRVMDQYAAIGVHGYFTSDDLGGQLGLLFSERHFRDLYLPFYEELVDYCHGCGMHFWLHIDGAIEPIIDDLVAIGVDTLHPLQEPPMDLPSLVERYRGRLTFHVGIDVQYLMPGGTPREVAAGTWRLIDMCDSETGGCLLLHPTRSCLTRRWRTSPRSSTPR